MLRNAGHVLLLCRGCGSPVKPQISSLARAATTEAAAASEQTPKKQLRKAKHASDWEAFTLDKAHAELLLQQKEYFAEANMRRTHQKLIRFSLSADGHGLVQLLTREFQYGSNRKNALLIAEGLRILGHIFEQSTKASNQPDLTSLYFSTANMIFGMRQINFDSGAALLYAFMKLEDWIKVRVQDDMTPSISASIRDIEDILSKKLLFLRLGRPVFPFAAEEREILRARLIRLIGQEERPPFKKVSSDGYEDNTPLLQVLSCGLEPQVYEGNPFEFNVLKEEQRTKIFAEQLKAERAVWLHLDNPTYDKTRHPKSAEVYFSELGWRQKIEDEISHLLSTSTSNSSIHSIIKAVGIPTATTIIYQSTLKILSKGSSLVSMYEFNSSFLAPLLLTYSSRYAQYVNNSEDKLWADMFEQFSRFFIDPEISRTHTHREWWQACSQTVGAPPDANLRDRLLARDVQETIQTFIRNVVFKACTILRPSKKKNQPPVNTPIFSYHNVSIEEETFIREDATKVTVVPMIQIHKAIPEFLSEHPFEKIAFISKELPMIVPPRPWIDFGVGGPEYTRQSQIVRRLTDYSHMDINKELTKRIKSPKQARPVWDALNQLGSTPWTINEPMLNVLTKAFSMGSDPSMAQMLGHLSVPVNPGTIHVPNYREIFGEVQYSKVTPEMWLNFGKTKSAAEKERNEVNSLWCFMLYRLVQAHHFKGRHVFFPHNMDFRGRVYPISPHLSHMGDDVNRCILKFARGRELGRNGLMWLKRHAINLTGKWKRSSIAERDKIADEIVPFMIDSAENPFEGRRWWMESDDPWQTLSACFEIRDALAAPDSAKFISHLPVHQDGSCNGLQHYAALGRDHQGGEEVNLLPCDKPSDVYTSVAQRVEQKRLEDENSSDPNVQDIARRLRQAMPQEVPRKVIKQTVMTTVYGVTMYGAVLQIKRQLKALGIEGEDTKFFASYLAKKTFASLNDAFRSSMQLKDWFRKCAKGVCQLHRTTEWVTPLGLPVVQPYVEVTAIKGHRILQPVLHKQVDAFPPNYVHSLDSTHMMLTSLECAKRGITFAAVHDCYWTHACSVDSMNEICRRMFVNLHSEPLVDQLGEAFHDLYLPNDIVSRMREDERLHFQELFTPQVQPGELDINEVLRSVYFFS